MFAGELKAAAAKLQREQRERAEREKARLEKERVLAERQRARQEQREAEASQRRLAAIAAQQAEEERHTADLEQNRGVALRVTLAAAPADHAAAAARGIRRAADKLVLPASVGASLTAQDAARNGPSFFEVAAQNGGRTHAGVLEFTAPEGVCLVPPKVANCLWGLPSSSQRSSNAGGGSPGGAQRCAGKVWLRYRRLPKGTHVRFQPELRAFHEAMAAEPELLRSTLEACLLAYATLSEGDWVQVSHEGATYNLRVLELQPEPAVSVIDTDITADVGPSIETEGYLRAQEEEAAREAERQRQLQEAAERAATEAAAAEEAAAAAEAAATAARLAMQAEASARLPPEPEEGQPGCRIAFRLPDGSRLQRRFAADDSLRALYDYADSQGAGGLEPGRYSLVLQFPRKRLVAGAGGSLADAGLKPGEQVALFLEAESSGSS